MSENKDERLLVVLHWSDGSRDPFFANKPAEYKSFLLWKQKRLQCESPIKELISVEEYNQKYLSK